MSQYNDDQLHGLIIKWWDDGDIAVGLYKNGNELGWIKWNTEDWTKTISNNPSVFDGVLSIDDFRPDNMKKQ